MSMEPARAFLDNWINENLHSLADRQNISEAKKLAKRCLHAAKVHGISKADLECACGQGLIICMCDAQSAVADASVSKLMED